MRAPFGILDRPLQQRRPQAGQARDVRLDVLRVEAEVLEPVVGAGVARAQPLAGAGARDVDGHGAALAHAANEAVAEHPRLVVDDGEVEGRHVPLGGLAGIGRLQMDVVDPVWHQATSMSDDWMRCTPAACMSAHALAREPPVVDPTAGVLDDERREAGLAGVDGGPRDAEVGGQAGEEHALQTALAQVADEAGGRRAVGLVERGVGVDALAVALPDDQLRVGNLEIGVQLGIPRPLHAVIRPQHLTAVGELRRLEGLLAGVRGRERRRGRAVCQSWVRITCSKAGASRLMTGTTWSPSFTGSAPPGTKPFCTSTTRNTSCPVGFIVAPPCAASATEARPATSAIGDASEPRGARNCAAALVVAH